jgi:hypothetical protein
MYELHRLRVFTEQQLHHMEGVIAEHTGKAPGSLYQSKIPGVTETGESIEKLEWKMEAIKDTVEYINTELVVQQDLNAKKRETMKADFKRRVDDQVMFFKQQLTEQSRSMTALWKDVEAMKEAQRKDPITNSKLKVTNSGPGLPADVDSSRSMEELRYELAALAQRQETVEKQEPAAADVDDYKKRVTIAQEDLNRLEESGWRKLIPIVSDICLKLNLEFTEPVIIVPGWATNAVGQKFASDSGWSTPSQNTRVSMSQANIEDPVRSANAETRGNVSLLAEALGTMDLRITALEKASQSGSLSPKFFSHFLKGEAESPSAPLTPRTPSRSPVPSVRTPKEPQHLSASNLQIPIGSSVQSDAYRCDAPSTFDAAMLPPRSFGRGPGSPVRALSPRSSLEHRSTTPPGSPHLSLASPPAAAQHRPIVATMDLVKISALSAEAPVQTPRISSCSSPKYASLHIVWV